MRILALDFGERRIGVAVTDPTGVLAQPLETLERRPPPSRAHLDQIAELALEYGAAKIVVGLPLHMDGRAGPEVEAARAFGLEVEARTGVPVDYIDERWTTREAERTLRELGVPGRKRRRHLDPIAASLILRTYLERGLR